MSQFHLVACSAINKKCRSNAERQQILQNEKETGIRIKSLATVAWLYGIPPSMFNHRMNKRTELLGHASGGTPIFNQGKTCSLELN